MAEQEAIKLDKQKGFELLARCSKAISDATYLDEIGKNHRYYEKLSSADKREINQRALVYAEQVPSIDMLQSVYGVWKIALVAHHVARRCSCATNMLHDLCTPCKA